VLINVTFGLLQIPILTLLCVIIKIKKRMKTIIITFCILTLLVSYTRGHNYPDKSVNNYEDTPLYFTANLGQTNETVLFMGKGNNCNMFFNEKGTTFSLINPNIKQNDAFDAFALSLVFVNSNSSPTIFGEEIQTGASNYFIGNDPNKWRKNVPNYSRIRLNDLYNGIDLIYYGNQNQLEYDFIVKPGMDPKQIRMAYNLGSEGEKALSIDINGNLVISTPMGKLIEHKPSCYQIIGGKKIQVEGNFRIIDRIQNIFTISIGKYDNKSTLIIDPVIEYSSYFGGSDRDWCFGAAKDKEGNIYLSGNTNSTDYPVKTGSYSITSRGNIDCFITKLDPTCSKVIYSTYIGGYYSDYGRGVCVDSNGNAYITANTNSYDFPTTSNAMFRSIIGPYNVQHPDIAIVKLSAEGNSLIYSTFFGGAGVDAGGTIYADSLGNAYISLFTESSDLAVTANVFGNKYIGKKDGFILKLDPLGNKIYSTYIGGSDDDFISSIVADKSGNLVILGNTKSADFPTTASAFNTKQKGDMDLFITKINNDGSKVLFSAIMGGKANENPSSLKLDNVGNIYIAGFTESLDFPVTKNAFQVSLKGNRDGFVSKISPDGGKLLYSTLIGGSEYDKVNSLEISSKGIIYMAGATSSKDFPVTKNALDQTYNGGFIDNGNGGDIFLCLLDINSAKLKYATYFGGTDNEESPNLIVNNENEIILIGQTESYDLPVTKNAINKSNKGKTEVFITKLNLNSKLSKNNKPQLTNPVKDFTANYKQLFKIKIPDNLFTDKDDFEVLPLIFTLNTGEPLPNWMKYDPQTRTFVGLPSLEGSWKIKILTVDNHNATASHEFQLKVVDPRNDKKAVDLEYGCVAYYPFNGNADDAAQKHYNGLVKRARLCEDKNGKPNSAYCFNGSDNYIQIDSVKEFYEIDAISVCAWINPASFENYVAWISKPLNDDRSQFRVSFGREPFNIWGVVFYNETWNGNDARNSLIPLNQWSFVVATVNQITGEVKLYLNGKEVGNFSNNKRILKSDYPWYIGYQADDKNYFDGKIDEVRLYQRILSPEEIMALYNLK
jgi:hypothetical protein